jgi:hypothetical protein
LAREAIINPVLVTLHLNHIVHGQCSDAISCIFIMQSEEGQSICCQNLFIPFA